MDEIDEVIADFAVEARESLEDLEQALVTLEADPADAEQITICFRVLHTIKGTCGFFGFESLERLTHAGEQLMSALRDGEVTLCQDGATVLLEMLDVLRRFMDTIQATGEEGGVEYGDLAERLDAMGGHSAGGETPEEAAPQEAAPDAAAAPPRRALDEQDLEVLKEFFAETREGLEEIEESLVELESDPTADGDHVDRMFRVVHTIKGTCSFFDFRKLETLAHTGEHLLSDLRERKYPMSQPCIGVLIELLDALRLASRTVEAESSDASLDFSDLCARLEQLRDLRGVGFPDPPRSKTPSAEPAEPVAAPPSTSMETSVRVATPLLDELVALVGELVLTRNQMVQRVRSFPDPVLTPAAQRLNRVASQLQEAVMKTRMQPMQTVFKRFPRLVRDVAHACGKQVALEVHGGATELDRTLIEAIKDPLTHIVRNCIDHGIESPDDRVERGKPMFGLVRVAAYHKGGFVNVDISDDGRGIDVEKLKRKAVNDGRLRPDQAAEMTNREALNLMFVAGLSTAETLTAVSGRGVGMDVVKSKIERNGGAVEIVTELGAGTCLKLKIPLTLAIVPALMVRCDDQRYAIPQANLLELIRIDPRDERQLEQVGDARYHRLRGRLLPLVWLRDALGLAPGDDSRPQHVAVLQAGDHTYGLVVDRVEDSLEIVVKPLDNLLRHIPVYGGTMITGDGRASLILDPVGLALVSRLSAQEQRARSADVMRVEEAQAEGLGDPLLLFESEGGGRMAIPLAQVARLEEIERERLEHVGGRCVVQYRDGILPLVFLDEALPDRRSVPRRIKTSTDEPADPQSLQVVVHSHGDRNVGLVVGVILDTVRENERMRAKSSRPGVKYTFVQDERITELLDLHEVIGMREPDFYRDDVAVGG